MNCLLYSQQLTEVRVEISNAVLKNIFILARSQQNRDKYNRMLFLLTFPLALINYRYNINY